MPNDHGRAPDCKSDINHYQLHRGLNGIIISGEVSWGTPSMGPLFAALTYLVIALTAARAEDRTAQAQLIVQPNQADLQILSECRLFLQRPDLRTPLQRHSLWESLQQSEKNWKELDGDKSAADNVLLARAEIRATCNRALDESADELFKHAIRLILAPPTSQSGFSQPTVTSRHVAYDRRNTKRTVKVHVTRFYSDKPQPDPTVEMEAKDSASLKYAKPQKTPNLNGEQKETNKTKPAPQIATVLSPSEGEVPSLPTPNMTAHASMDDVPQIEPWPPPVPTDQAGYTIDLEKVKTVGDFSDAVMERLNNASIRNLRFWGAPNGVAIVAPLEAVDADAKPIDRNRSNTNKGSSSGGPLAALLEGFRRLLSEPIRDSRLLLITLTTDSRAKNPKVPMTTQIAQSWIQNEYMRPDVNRDIRLTTHHFVVVSVYEFRKEENSDPQLLTHEKMKHGVAGHLAASQISFDGLLR